LYDYGFLDYVKMNFLHAPEFTQEYSASIISFHPEGLEDIFIPKFLSPTPISGGIAV
jgi:hypothetical protein